MALLNTKSMTFNTVTASDRSHPLFTLYNPIISADAYCVQNFMGVNNFYNIDDRNNAFSFSEYILDQDLVDISSTILFSIPIGNYTLNTFMTALQTSLNSNGTQIYTVTNNSLTNKISITGATLNFKLLSVPNNCYYELGYSTFNTYSSSQTAACTYDFSGLKNIYIVSNSLGYGQSLACGKNLNIIASIPVISPYLGVISYIPPQNFVSSNISEINSIEFSLYDERFRNLTVSTDWSMTLMFVI